MKFIKMLEPKATAKIKYNRIMVGYNLIGLFESEDGMQEEKILAFTPKRQMFKQTSKYIPHQGKQEKARRVRQMASV